VAPEATTAHPFLVAAALDGGGPIFAVTALDIAVSVGRYTSITTGADGLGLISYLDGGDRKVAHCAVGACLTR